MKNLVWYLGALSATAAFLLLRNAMHSRPVPVEELAHRLEGAWADHHTVA